MILTERKKDTLLVAIYTYSGLILSFIFSSLFIRFDGGDMYGIYAHSLAILSFIAIALGFGFQIGLVKINISIEKYKTIATSTFMLWSLVVMCGMLFYYLAYYKNDFDTTFLLVLAAGCATLTELTAALWQWMKKIVAFRGWIALRSVFNIMLVLLLIYEYISLNIFLVGLASVAISHFSFLVYKSGAVSINRQSFLGSERFSDIKTKLWSQSKFFWASLLAVAVYGKVGIVMLKFFSFTNQEIGRYAYLYTIMAAFLILPAAIQTYLLRPLFSNEMDGSSVLKKTLPIYVITGAACSFIFWKILPVVVEMIIGESSELLSVYWAFAPSILIVYIANLLGMSLMTGGREKERAIVQWISAGSHIILNLILIPLYGLKGAALATTGSYLILLCGFLIVTLKNNIWNIRNFTISLIIFTLASVGFFIYDYIIFLPLIISLFLLYDFYFRKQKIRK